LKKKKLDKRAKEIRKERRKRKRELKDVKISEKQRQDEINETIPTEHHKLPKSRGGDGTPTITVNKRIHQLYSQLFQVQIPNKKDIEMLPEEVVHWLNKTFWGNEYEITIRRIEQ